MMEPLLVRLTRQGVLDAVEGIVDLLAYDADHCDHYDRDEGKNDRILHQPLASFRWNK